jgi:hypothetical protein
VHWLDDGHAIATGEMLLSIVTGVGVPAEAGSNVTSCPTASMAVHWFVDGHAIAAIGSPPVPSRRIGADQERGSDPPLAAAPEARSRTHAALLNSTAQRLPRQLSSWENRTTIQAYNGVAAPLQEA